MSDLRQFLQITIDHKGNPIIGQHLEVNDAGTVSPHFGYRVDTCPICKQDYIISKATAAQDCGAFHKPKELEYA